MASNEDFTPAVTVAAEFVVPAEIAPAVYARLLDLAEEILDEFGDEIIDHGIGPA